MNVFNIYNNLTHDFYHEKTLKLRTIDFCQVFLDSSLRQMEVLGGFCYKYITFCFQKITHLIFLCFLSTLHPIKTPDSPPKIKLIHNHPLKNQGKTQYF